MDLDRRVETLEQWMGQVADPITTIEIVGVPGASDPTAAMVFTCTLGRDCHFTVKKEDPYVGEQPLVEQACRRAMRLRMGRIDHQLVRLAALRRERREDRS
jgi:hypothetical protein